MIGASMLRIDESAVIPPFIDETFIKIGFLKETSSELFSFR